MTLKDEFLRELEEWDITERDAGLLAERLVRLVNRYINEGISDSPPVKDEKEEHYKDVHTEHCCVNCGCKYGEEDTCPVVQGWKKQSNPCRGDCRDW